MILFGFGWFPELAKTAASLPLNLASPINAGAITMILSIVVVPLVSLFTVKPDEKYLDSVLLHNDCKTVPVMFLAAA